MIGIYKIQNLINGKIYIGQSVHVKTRFNQHKAEARNGNNRPLYNAIRKYSIENFSFEIIEECSQESLDEREIYWIQYFNSFKNGYNLTPGGNSPIKADIDFIYSLWDEGKSFGEIVEITSLSKTCISNYLHDYENYTPHESNRRGGIIVLQKINHNNEGNKICQYTFKGEFIKEWSSQKHIERELKIDADLIGRVLNGRQIQAGGFQWKRIGEPPEDISKKVQYRFGVIQYSLDGIEVQRFPSVKAAALAMGCDTKNISRVCKKEKGRTTACGFKWEYDYSVYY